MYQRWHFHPFASVPVCFVKVEDWVISVLSLVLCNQHAVSEVCL